MHKTIAILHKYTLLAPLFQPLILTKEAAYGGILALISPFLGAIELDKVIVIDKSAAIFTFFAAHAHRVRHHSEGAKDGLQGPNDGH